MPLKVDICIPIDITGPRGFVGRSKDVRHKPGRPDRRIMGLSRRGFSGRPILVDRSHRADRFGDHRGMRHLLRRNVSWRMRGRHLLRPRGRVHPHIRQVRLSLFSASWSRRNDFRAQQAGRAQRVQARLSVQLRRLVADDLAPLFAALRVFRVLKKWRVGIRHSPQRAQRTQRAQKQERS